MPLNREQLLNIEAVIGDIYGESNIETSFITGSIANGDDRVDSDIDIFVCHTDTIKGEEHKRSLFTEYYYELHDSTGRIPDDISPGEVLGYSQLKYATNRIITVEPSEIIINRLDFDAICWAGMIDGKKEIMHPFTDAMSPIIIMSRVAIKRWVTALSDGQNEILNGDKFLRKNVSCPGYYDAH